MFAYKEIKRDKIYNMFEEYVKSLSGVYDDYLEEHILGSTFYKMTYSKKEIGYFAIWAKKKITQFYIKDDCKHLAQGCFKSILNDLKVTSAYVPTCDSFFLGLAMDLHKKIELQAYFFKESSRAVPAANYPKTMLRLASLSDEENIKNLSGDFFDDLNQLISNRQIYVMEEEDAIYGFGILAQNEIHKKYRSIGMFTVEDYRHRGVGRSIVLHLKDLVHTMGYETIPGCWYLNYQSKRTLESCGYAAVERLLNITF